MEAEDVSQSLGMEFGIAKCMVAHARRGDWRQGTPLRQGTFLQPKYQVTYKHLANVNW